MRVPSRLPRAVRGTARSPLAFPGLRWVAVALALAIYEGLALLLFLGSSVLASPSIRRLPVVDLVALGTPSPDEMLSLILGYGLILFMLQGHRYVGVALWCLGSAFAMGAGAASLLRPPVRREMAIAGTLPIAASIAFMVPAILTTGPHRYPGWVQGPVAPFAAATFATGFQVAAAVIGALIGEKLRPRSRYVLLPDRPRRTPASGAPPPPAGPDPALAADPTPSVPGRIM